MPSTANKRLSQAESDTLRKYRNWTRSTHFHISSTEGMFTEDKNVKTHSLLLFLLAIKIYNNPLPLHHHPHCDSSSSWNPRVDDRHGFEDAGARRSEPSVSLSHHLVYSFVFCTISFRTRTLRVLPFPLHAGRSSSAGLQRIRPWVRSLNVFFFYLF